MNLLAPRDVEIRHFSIFCGLGGGARGLNQASPKVEHLQARFRCIGGVDSDAAAIADFARVAGAPGTVLDLFDRAQYRAWHGQEPPEDWREAGPDDLRRAARGERPHIVFGSAPCRGFSGLLSQRRSESDRYQALNQLAIRGLWLALEAWGDDPPELVLWENVPRIATRGRAVLDVMIRMLEAYGYATAETTHDCGELGALAQSRRRFLLVARHRQKVPPFLYQPPRRRLRPVGDVLGRLPLPGDPLAGPMHRLAALQWKTWVRLAFVEAGQDWRSLQKLRVADGVLADWRLVPAAWHNGALGVTSWVEPAGTVTGNGFPTGGSFSVADPRIAQTGEYAQLGVRRWNEPTGAVTGQSTVGGGAHAVADPWGASSGTVCGPHRPGGGDLSVADPRIANGPAGPHFNNVFRVVPWGEAAGAITAGAGPSSGGQAVADPRVGLPGGAWEGSGHYGVVPWTSPAHAVTARAGHDNGAHSVADPRCLPAAEARLVALIIARDGTWHRPFTTLELAALQDLFDLESSFRLHGTSDTAWRERIGNAVPAAAARAVGEVMGRTLLLAWLGETFVLDAEPVWVRPLEIALAVDVPELVA